MTLNPNSQSQFSKVIVSFHNTWFCYIWRKNVLNINDEAFNSGNMVGMVRDTLESLIQSRIIGEKDDKLDQKHKNPVNFKPKIDHYMQQCNLVLEIR